MVLFSRELYTEDTLDEAMRRLDETQSSDDVNELLRRVGINRKTLARTAQKGMEEYFDGLVDLRHGWKPKMMDGAPNEKREIYGDLYETIRRIDRFSESYVSAMRLIANAALVQLREITAFNREDTRIIKQALHYAGARYDFDEGKIGVTSFGSEVPLILDDAYSSIASRYMQLKDLLNLMEDATNPHVYENVRNTNEFPEARIGKCFEVAHEIEATLTELKESYRLLLDKGNLSRAERKRIDGTLKLLDGISRRWLTRTTQWYAALQFHEKPWDRAYKISIGATGAGVAGAAYSFYPVLERMQSTGVVNTLTNYSDDTMKFFASAVWTIISGIGIYAFTDAGPKTARFFRKLDERVVSYKWV